MEWLAIADLLKHRTSALSGGQRQRIAIGRALLSNPELLLMDEPISALDPQGKHTVLSCLERIHQETAIPMIYVTHYREELEQLADLTLCMKYGQFEAAPKIVPPL